ncbi:MASE3 domain-containing protein [Alkalihalobacillus sp. LMS39]|uniref:MASE3 domain-containing protein n=1 Tax=Alkalihalobacillus sp. LMS39 TaxID=2924032 RepID=UPI001FB24DB4|nr:MASE3 domain-containing protein [Alkalihalobacillus sp. LMS39]UOE94286.1 ATP-binding protein [Alkalihalobacillus sp. LMS39]
MDNHVGVKPLHIDKSERYSIALIVVGILLFVLVFFQGIETNLYHIGDHLFFHTVLELISIAISFSIFLYGWLAYPFTKSRLLLLVSLTFFVVAVLDMFHTFSYTGMPFSIAENNQTTAWFWIMARLAEASVLLIGLVFTKVHSYVRNKMEKTMWVLLTIGVTLFVPYVILNNIESLPLLLSGGPTPLKNGIEYVIAAIHFVAIIVLWFKYKQNRNYFYLNLMRACYFIILCGMTVTVIATVFDFTVIIAHVFKVGGYFFILKAFYYANIKVPLESKKQTEKKLHDIESELELLFTNSEDAIFVVNLHTKEIVRRNAAFKKMFGYMEETPLNIEQLTPFNRKGEFEYVYQELCAGRAVVDFKTCRQRKDLTLINVSMTISPMKVKDNEIICSVIMRDISEQKKAEFELKRTRKELQETLEQYEGVIFKYKKENDEFIYTLIDGKLIRKKGQVPKDFVGKAVTQFYPFTDSNLNAEIFEIPNNKAWNGETVEFQFDDGDETIFHVSLKPIQQGQEVIEVIGNVVDITKLIKTEELLRKSEKLSVVGELAAGFAHEIRNPLTTVKGFLQLIGSEADETTKEYIKIMLNEIVRLEMITNEFMVVAKPQVSRFEMEDVASIIEHVIQFLRPQALLHSIEMETTVYGVIPPLYCDKHQLQQVLINIYKNAMEAMSHGGTVSTEISIGTNYVTIAITDQGCGIPEELISKLGEPFYTLKEKGTGLGLMVSKKIIDAHQGMLHIKSEINVGTTMKIQLPIAGE